MIGHDWEKSQIIDLPTTNKENEERKSGSGTSLIDKIIISRFIETSIGQNNSAAVMLWEVSKSGIKGSISKATEWGHQFIQITKSESKIKQNDNGHTETNWINIPEHVFDKIAEKVDEVRKLDKESQLNNLN